MISNFQLIKKFSFFYLRFLICILLFASCSDFLQPVKGTENPSEYEFNYWLLQSTYLFEEELESLSKTGDSVQLLYDKLKDPYTRYVEPSKSQSAEISINTSFVPGDVGMTYLYNKESLYPLFVNRVYHNGPAFKAKINRYSNIRSINGIELKGENAYNVYQAVLDSSTSVKLLLVYDSTEYTYELTKENIYAPTVFIDTLYETIFILITEFKLSTSDEQNGSYGELKAYLDSTQNITQPRVIDIRDNPGGHVEKCVAMADLFVKNGVLSTRSWRSFNPDGTNAYREISVKAKEGDSGEKGKFIILTNNRSASCAEIFAAAVSENEDIPIVGVNTYGKGIGQTNWKTKADGLAIITNLEFLTPKGNSYHKKGLTPVYNCGAIATSACAVEALNKHFNLNKKILKKESFLNENYIEITKNNFYSSLAILNSNELEGNKK